MVLTENCEYGFRRNSLGLRPFALVVATASGAAGALWPLISPSLVAPPSGALLTVALLVDVCLLIFWAFLVHPRWVERAAWTYAERLMETAILPGFLSQ
jgi:hypothetical protein